jgi:hypothetical protein
LFSISSMLGKLPFFIIIVFKPFRLLFCFFCVTRVLYIHGLHPRLCELKPFRLLFCFFVLLVHFISTDYIRGYVPGLHPKLCELKPFRLWGCCPIHGSRPRTCVTSLAPNPEWGLLSITTDCIRGHVTSVGVRDIRGRMTSQATNPEWG